MNQIADNAAKHLIRHTDFFLAQNFKKYQVDVDSNRKLSITDIDIKCLGFGLFNKEKVLKNFFQYLSDLLGHPPKAAKSLKLTLSGFDLIETNNFESLIKVSQQIVKSGINLKSLWIHTSHLSGMSIEDFKHLLYLVRQLNELNFEDYSLQCASWKFQDGQPEFVELDKIFSQLGQETYAFHLLLRQFRLEISGWWYTDLDAKRFLGFRADDENKKQMESVLKMKEKERKQYMSGKKYKQEDFEKGRVEFHSIMENLVSELLEVMDNIQIFELDMRNCHDSLKMKSLKGRLDNVSKSDRQEMSIISKTNKRAVKEVDEEEAPIRININM